MIFAVCIEIRLLVQSGTTIAALAMTGIEVSTLGHYPLVGELHLGEMAFLLRFCSSRDHKRF